MKKTDNVNNEEKKEQQVKEPSELKKEQQIKELQFLMGMYHSGNPDLKEEAIERLWKKTEMFVWSSIQKWYPTFYTNEYCREELYSAAKVGFMSCIKDFDPLKGTLTTFLTYPIKHEMLEWINREFNNSTGHHSKMMKQVQDAEKLLAAQGCEITSSAISAVTGLSVKKVDAALIRIEARNMQSLNSDEQREEVIRGQCKSPEEMYLEKEGMEAIAKALQILSDQDRRAIILYFGLDGENQRSYNAVAKKMHISAPQAQTCVVRGLHILKGVESLQVMFGRGAQNYRQSQLDSIEISLVTNDNFINAYNMLDDETEMEKSIIQGDAVFLSF